MHEHAPEPRHSAGLTVRPMAASDVAAVACAHLTAWQTAFRGILSDALLDGLHLQDFESAWRQIMQAQNRTTLVAERDGAVLGYVGFGPAHGPGAARTGEVYGIYVHPAHWRAGAGSALLAQAMAQLGQAGHTRVVIWTMAGNQIAHGFYTRHGFVVDGASRTSERHGEQFPEIRFTRDL